jgi:hypothetical protein
MSKERRQSSRVEILNRIHGHVAALDVTVVVREMSLGGMRLETPFSFPVGAEHEFRLEMGDGSKVIVRGRILRCLQTADADGRDLFISGVQFVDDDQGDDDGQIGEMLGKIT